MSAARRSDSALRPLPWRRMGWVLWRQHRVAFLGLVGLLGALGGSLWVVGLGLHHAYTVAAACHPASSSACGALATDFSEMDRLLADGYVLQVLPALIGAFIGAPLLARELETEHSATPGPRDSAEGAGPSPRS